MLHEDKQYFPDAEEVFGQGVDARVEEMDHQPMTKPIIEPIKTKMHMVEISKIPETKYETSYMV